MTDRPVQAPNELKGYTTAELAAELAQRGCTVLAQRGSLICHERLADSRQPRSRTEWVCRTADFAQQPEPPAGYDVVPFSRRHYTDRKNSA